MIGFLTANPTPKKPKRSVKQQNRKYTNKRTKNDDEEVTDDEGARSLIQLHYSFVRSLMCCNLLYLPFDLSYFVEWTARKKRKLFNAKLLPKEYKYLDRDEVEELSLWDDPNDKPTQVKVTCFKESLEPPSALPITSERPPEKQIVGYAAQSFNQPEIPGVMSGWVRSEMIYPLS